MKYQKSILQKLFHKNRKTVIKKKHERKTVLIQTTLPETEIPKINSAKTFSQKEKKQDKITMKSYNPINLYNLLIKINRS